MSLYFYKGDLFKILLLLCISEWWSVSLSYFNSAIFMTANKALQLNENHKIAQTNNNIEYTLWV